VLGTSDSQDVRLPRAERSTTGVEIGAQCLLRTSVQHSRSPFMSRGPSGKATVCRSGCRLAVQYCSISETYFFSFFSSNLSSNKKDRAAFARGPSQGGNAPGRAATAGWGSYRVAYFANQKAPRIDEAQFLLTFRVFAWRTRRAVRLPITSAGHFSLLASRSGRHPVPRGMLRRS
jgi:hypothetical protein